ncbi:hypothetical protein M0G74_03170 [Microbulbifer sp. CAU 1566]|uniref:hypothetical protein n=1 Tax=Microbulbifer sp. CAU 1566 TaxID=2933269 RepID=UPI002004DF1E|nr:hypothetical protein [Microbulbifer sp. CAU 1566]MCK7596267.1 hypothetical protein [Microbulbifer sp. CAU 1566]
MGKHIIFHRRIRRKLHFCLVIGLFLTACAREQGGASEFSLDTNSFSVDAEGRVSIGGVRILLGVDRMDEMEALLGKAPLTSGVMKSWPNTGLSAVEKHGCLQSIMVALRPTSKLALEPVAKMVVIEPFKGDIAVVDLTIAADRSIRELNAASEIKFSQFGPHTVRYSIPGSDGISVYLYYGEHENSASNLQFSVSKDKYDCRAIPPFPASL